MEAKILSVESACFHINKTNPPQLVVSAEGKVNSSGWSNGRLVPWIYIEPPTDGIQDFDFVASKPKDFVLMVISTITGGVTFEMENWTQGVRIHSSSNNKVIMLNDENCQAKGSTVSALGVPHLLDSTDQ